MNRLHHLSKTLPQNINDNQSYGNHEFIIIDYNSTDGLEEWVLNNLANHLTSGLVKYYRTDEPQFFDRCHSRNMAFKKAAGDILCNIDADNYTGPLFAHYLNDYFHKNHHSFLTPGYTLRDVMGRLCVKATDFDDVHGFNENLKGYGYDDMDIYKRLEANRLIHGVITGHPEFLNAIAHDNIERYENEFLGKSIHTIFIAYLKPYLSEVIFLYKNNLYDLGRILDCELVRAKKMTEGNDDNETALLGTWKSGVWREQNNDIYLVSTFLKSKKMKCQNNVYHLSNKMFYEVTDDHVLDQLILSKTEIDNRIACSFHDTYQNRPPVNQKGYGKGKLVQLLP